jgi:hypothetical protein
MGRPKKTDEAPKRRGRPPKNPDKKAAPKAKKAKGGGRRGKKPADSSTFTFRIDNRLRAELKKRAPKEYTSESSLCNRFIAMGLQWGTFQRVSVVLSTLAEKAGIELDPAIQQIAEDLDKEPADETETDEPEVIASNESDDEDVASDDDDQAVAETTTEDEDVDLDDEDEESDEELAAASENVSAAKASSADQPEKQAAAGQAT